MIIIKWETSNIGEEKAMQELAEDVPLNFSINRVRIFFIIRADNGDRNVILIQQGTQSAFNYLRHPWRGVLRPTIHGAKPMGRPFTKTILDLVQIHLGPKCKNIFELRGLANSIRIVDRLCTPTDVEKSFLTGYVEVSPDFFSNNLALPPGSGGVVGIRSSDLGSISIVKSGNKKEPRTLREEVSHGLWMFPGEFEALSNVFKFIKNFS